MKKGLLVIAMAGLAACGPQEKEEVKLDTTAQKASYAIGYKTADQMRGRVDDLDLDAFVGGMRDAWGGEDESAKMSEEDMMAAIRTYQEEKQKEHMAKLEQQAADNKAEAEKFFAENGARDGVETLESGLQYEVLAEGEEGAASPTLEDTVKAHYHGTLLDGTVFDSSVDRGEPASFPLARVIKGWQEALPMMKVGDKWKLYVPSDLAYGERGAREPIGPNAALMFEVELLGVEESETAE